MQLFATNCDTRELTPAVFWQLVSGQVPGRESLSSGRPWFGTRATSGVLLSFEHYVGMELSLVPEVESVFVEWDKENGRAYHVISIINDRDPEIRTRVYEREQAVMDQFPSIDFTFRVISRMNRKMTDVVNQVGKLAFKR